MRVLTLAIGMVFALVVLAEDAAAQSNWSYRARVTFEAQGARPNGSSPSVRPGDFGWKTRGLFVAAADSLWEKGRLRLGAGLVAAGSSEASWSLQAREAYARISATSWMDVEAGRRLVRWGVGYGFSPTGLLDPPRLATDPTDRLSRQDGMPLVRADLFRGGTSLTIAVASPTLWRGGAPADAATRMVAVRVRTVVAGGLDVALVGSAAPGRPTSVGGNVTHVVGQRLEWHAELLVDARAVSAVAGLQYTLPGVNVVMEYHRASTSGRLGENLSRVFGRVARAGADLRIAPELIVIRALDDGTWTVVAGLGWTARRQFEVYVRALHQAGPRTSWAGLAPVSGTVSLGATLRF